MANNYIIISSNGEYFGGWSRLGVMCMKSSGERSLAYRMSYTVAKRTLQKVEEFTHQNCMVERF